MRALLLTGAVGTGKTVVAIEVAQRLGAAGGRPAVLDLDWLAWIENRTGAGTVDELLLQNLRAVWPNYLAAGADSAVMARMMLWGELVPGLAAVLGCEIAVVRLNAPLAVLRERLRLRDTGGTLDEHLASLENWAELTAAAAPGAPVVETEGRSVTEVAYATLKAAGWP